MKTILSTLQEIGAKPERGNIREWLPYIIGYTHIGNWDSALNLTREAVEQNPNYAPMLCDLWRQRNKNTPANAAQESAWQTVQGELSCGEITP